MFHQKKHPYFQDITDNKYYSQFLITSDKSNLLSKNILNESLSMIKSVDDSQGNIQKMKNVNNNLEKMERFEKYGSNNKLSNINIMTMGSSNNIMKNINNSNSVNKNYNSNNNNNSNLDPQHSQRNLKESIENENSFKKDKNKIKLPKIVKAKANNVNTNINSNNLMGTFKANYAIIGGINFDLVNR